MNKKHFSILAVMMAFVGVIAAIGCSTSASSEVDAAAERPSITEAGPTPELAMAASLPANNEIYDGKKVTKTKKEWKALLTPEQYYILREEGTEQPYSGKLNDNHEDGYYYCAACGLKLFSSKAKYDSQTGWPSFYQPFNKKNVREIDDKTQGMKRTEVECARCGGHLGHVFDDGPEPTGLRYCMNSLSLKFERK